MESNTQSYLNALKKLSEDDFTKLIIKPLFQAMGYSRVDFNGGPYERGRDLIAQRIIPPKREPRVTFIQSKKIGDIQNVKFSAKLSQLLHQLRQCFTGKISTIDGTEIQADEVYLACPEQITNRLLEEISGQLNIPGKEIILYDGPRILEDIKDYLPELFKILTDVDENLLNNDKITLINQELLAALKDKKEISLKDFYSDLNFFVGSVDSNILLHLKPVIVKNEITKTEIDWEKIKRDISKLINKYDLEFCLNTLTEIETKYKTESSVYNSKKNQQKITSQSKLEVAIESLYNNTKEEIKVLNKSYNEWLEISESPESGEESIDIGDGINNLLPLLNKVISEQQDNRIDIIQLLKDIPKGNIFYPQLAQIVDSITQLQKLKSDIHNLKSTIAPKPIYKFILNTEKILSTINSGIQEYHETVVSINEGSCGPLQLKRFLIQTEKTLSLIDFLRDPNFPLSEAINFDYEKNNVDRVSISPHEIFSTGHDIAVYGGAGVGKTTTLQAYVALCSELENKIITYIPLNRLIEKYRDQYQVVDAKVREDLIQKLILISRRHNPTQENIEKLNLLLSQPISLILDGLDEVFNTMPFIIEEIANFKKQHPSIQLIVSSRDCVSYLKDIDFLGITLLPFTKDQLIKFIHGWLNDNEKAIKLIQSIEHKDLYEHIRTPLLSTIVCSLVEKGIDAPSSEFEIYSERLRLLTGEYDSFKNINRQEQKGDLLRLCSRKIAFSMHQRNVRSLSKTEIFNMLRSKMSESYSDELLNKCIAELENPCNVLIQDSLTNHYSFGHFRFQEHLVSCELSSNRSIDLSELTVQDWWRGALCLYAQENEIFNLIEDIFHKYGSIQKSKISLKAMINNSPKKYRSDLNSTLKNYNNADKYDQYLLGFENDYEYSNTYDDF